MWPTDALTLERVQGELASATPPPWRPPATGPLRVGGCWATFPRGLTGPGAAGDRAWAAAVTLDVEPAADRSEGQVVATHQITGRAGAGYRPGLLALRIGALLEDAVRGLGARPEVVLLDASGPDHPRRAGLAVHLGHELDVPTVGVTHRPLNAHGAWPADRRGATTPLLLDGEVVAAWLRTRAGTRPLVVHPGWRVSLEVALAVVSRCTGVRRTPEPLRQARHLARTARLSSG